jgi:hypothetical protein
MTIDLDNVNRYEFLQILRLENWICFIDRLALSKWSNWVGNFLSCYLMMKANPVSETLYLEKVMTMDMSKIIIKFMAKHHRRKHLDLA